MKVLEKIVAMILTIPKIIVQIFEFIVEPATWKKSCYSWLNFKRFILKLDYTRYLLHAFLSYKQKMSLLSTGISYNFSLKIP